MDFNTPRLTAISNFKLVNSQLHARKQKEYADAARKDYLNAGDMHVGFFYHFLTSFRRALSCSIMTLGRTLHHRQTHAELHTYVTNSV